MPPQTSMYATTMYTQQNTLVDRCPCWIYANINKLLPKKIIYTNDSPWAPQSPHTSVFCLDFARDIFAPRVITN